MPMKIVTLVVLVVFLAAGLCAQRPPDGKPSSATADGPKNPGTTGALGNIEVLSDTQGVDFRPYLSRVVDAVGLNWHTLIPAQARAPELKSGTVSIAFNILRDGHIDGMKLTHMSGDVGLDRAAWGGITASVPFAPLPEQYTGPFLSLRFNFHYNPKKKVEDEPTKNTAH